MSVSHRYSFSLEEEDLHKAVIELNEPENNEVRLQKIDELRNAFKNENNKLDLLDNSDEFLLRFLRARKFDHKKALRMLKNYHSQQKNWPDVYDKVKNPYLVKHVFDAGCFVVLTGKAIDGSAVCIGCPGKVENAQFTDFAAALTISIDQILKEERNQIYGVTIIEDMHYLNFELVQQVGPFVGRRFVNLLQDCLPIRIKGVNIVNESKLFNFVFAIVRPFIKDKTKKQIKSHGTKFELLHKSVEPSVLPPKYGGSGELDWFVAENWKNIIYSDSNLAIGK